jgi:1-acyl-sn-glycerol-3-phosphate acyltransferase
MRVSVKSFLLKNFKSVADVLLTLIYWSYFTLGFVFFFFPFYVLSFLFSRNRQLGFQKLNRLFLKGLFGLMETVTPGLTFAIDPRVRRIRSSIIVSNHVSYLDPILLVSLYEKQKTIVKSAFFKTPIFGWVIAKSGYIPSGSGDDRNETMLEQLETLPEYLASGGNLFAYPEGTRNREGRIGDFQKGVFKIAKRCDAPIRVLFVRNTDQLFAPGKFFFGTCARNTVHLKLIGEIGADELGGKPTVSEIASRVRSMMEEENSRVKIGAGE